MYLGPKCRPRETVENAIAVKEPPPRNLPFPQTFSVVTRARPVMLGLSDSFITSILLFFTWSQKYFFQMSCHAILWQSNTCAEIYFSISLKSEKSIFLLKHFSSLYVENLQNPLTFSRKKQTNKKNKSWHHHHCVWLSKPLPCGKTNEHWF